MNKANLTNHKTIVNNINLLSLCLVSGFGPRELPLDRLDHHAAPHDVQRLERRVGDGKDDHGDV
jgi:hypothetical protein